MMSRESLLGLGARRLAQILGISSENRRPDPDTNDGEIADRLSQVLAEPCPSDAARTLGQMLLDPRAPLEDIHRLRRVAKDRANGDEHGADQDAATTVYFAAIARALLSHDRKITTHSNETLKVAFEKLAAKGWMPDEMADLFEQAANRCG